MLLLSRSGSGSGGNGWKEKALSKEMAKIGIKRGKPLRSQNISTFFLYQIIKWKQTHICAFGKFTISDFKGKKFEPEPGGSRFEYRIRFKFCSRYLIIAINIMSVE